MVFDDRAIHLTFILHRTENRPNWMYRERNLSLTKPSSEREMVLNFYNSFFIKTERIMNIVNVTQHDETKNSDNN